MTITLTEAEMIEAVERVRSLLDKGQGVSLVEVSYLLQAYDAQTARLCGPGYRIGDDGCRHGPARHLAPAAPTHEED